MKYIDLFCGIGGFHYVLNSLGHTCVFASDIDKHCREVYNANFGMMPHGDITKIDVANVPDCDIICAGFPCQAFSNAGSKKTFSDSRGLLFDEIMRIAAVKRPKYIFLENVKHILKVDDGKVIKYIDEQLHENQYVVKRFIISPHFYGIPQNRERVYFICVRKDLYKSDFTINIPSHKRNYDLSSYLDVQYDPQYKISMDVLNVLNCWEEFVKIAEIGQKMSPTILSNHFETNDCNDFPEWKKICISKNKTIFSKYESFWKRWKTQYREILNKREVYSQLEWQVGPITSNDSIFNHFVQIRQSGVRVKKATFFPTLVAISQIPIYAKERRYITPRECARIQSYPDSFILHANDRVSYKQLGNSVNVHNVNVIVKSTLDFYED